MANVLNRTTCEYRTSVNTPDFPTEFWIINPDLSAVDGIPQKYWKCVGDLVMEMTQEEKDVIDAEEEEAQSSARNGFIINHVFYDSSKPYICGASINHKVVATIMWPGSDYVGMPKQINVVAKKEHLGGGNIVVFDVTNGVSIASIDVDDEDFNTVFTNTFQEFSSGKSLLEIHVKRASLSYLSFEF